VAIRSPVLPCVLFALRREAAPFLKRCSRRVVAEAPIRAWHCHLAAKSVLVLETGLGAAAMEKALDWLLAAPFQPVFVLSAGFSGALVADLHLGDLVLATEVIAPDGTRHPATWPVEAVPFRCGTLLTSPHLVGDPDEKRQLGERFGAVAVDMESSAAAQFCQWHGIPFGCLRAISDSWSAPLSPRLVGLLRGGRVAAGALLGALLKQPSLVKELWRLARDTRRAAEALGQGVAELLTQGGGAKG